MQATIFMLTTNKIQHGFSTIKIRFRTEQTLALLSMSIQAQPVMIWCLVQWNTALDSKAKRWLTAAPLLKIQ